MRRALGRTDGGRDGPAVGLYQKTGLYCALFSPATNHRSAGHTPFITDEDAESHSDCLGPASNRRLKNLETEEGLGN